MVSSLLLLLACAGSVPDTSDYHTDTVVVESIGSVLAWTLSGRPVEVLTRMDMDRLPVRSIQDALAYVGGVDLRRRGPNGVQADVGIRGGLFEQTAVLVNGMRVNDIQTGHHSLNIPVTLQDVEAIEVMKGGVARLYGSGGMDGTINIRVRPGSVSRISIGATAGDNSYRQIMANAGTTLGNTHHAIAAEVATSDGYMPSTDFAMGTISYMGNLPLTNKSNVEITAGITERSFGANGFYSPRFPDQWERVNTGLATVTYRSELASDMGLRVHSVFRTNYDEFLLKREDPAFYRNRHRTYSHTTVGHFTVGWDGMITSVSIEAGGDAISSSNLGVRDRTRTGIGMAHSMQLNEDLNVVGSVGLNVFSDTKPGFAYGIDATWRNHVGTLYSSVNSSFRIPTYTDLYYSDRATRGNDQLVHEKAMSYEVGLRGTDIGVSWHVAGYYRDTRNQIDYVMNFPKHGDSLFYAENVRNVRIPGIEVSAVRRLQLSAGVAITPTASVVWQDLSTSTPYADNAGIALRYVANILEVQTIAGIAVEWESAMIRWTSRVIRRSADQGALPVVHDLVAWYRVFDELRAFLEVSNLTSVNYIETGFIPMPPRWVRGGISAQLNMATCSTQSPATTK